MDKALTMAVWRRDHHGRPVAPGLIHHSDAGSRFTESLALHGLSASIWSVGDAYDNAMAESTIGLFTTEIVHQHGRRSPPSPTGTAGFSGLDARRWRAAQLPERATTK